MKFTIKQQIMLINLSLIGRVFLTPSVNINLLGNLLCYIPTNLKYLKIICINFEMEIAIKIYDLKIYKSGSCLISGKRLFNICRNMPSNNLINVEVDNNKILISTKRTIFRLNSYSIESPPQLIKYFVKKNKPFFKLNVSIHQDLVYQLLHNTYFSMPPKDDYRHIYNGMSLKLKRDMLTAVTIDGQRLSLCSLSTIIPLNISRFTLLLSQKTVQELLRIFTLKRNNREIYFSVLDTFLKVDIDNMYIISKLMPKSLFPDHKHLLKQKETDIKKLIINTKLLKESCERIAALNQERYSQITFFISHNNLKILSQNNEYEEAEEILPIQYEQEQIKISLNVEYLIDALKTITTEEVQIIFTDEFSSFSVTNYRSNTCLYLIMPMNA